MGLGKRREMCMLGSDGWAVLWSLRLFGGDG